MSKRVAAAVGLLSLFLPACCWDWRSAPPAPNPPAPIATVMEEKKPAEPAPFSSWKEGTAEFTAAAKRACDAFDSEKGFPKPRFTAELTAVRGILSRLPEPPQTARDVYKTTRDVLTQLNLANLADEQREALRQLKEWDAADVKQNDAATSLKRARQLIAEIEKHPAMTTP